MSSPKTLRGALNQIERMLQEEYGGALWDTLVALRGPDSRDKKSKNSCTAIIRSVAFPSRPCEEQSVFGEDNPERASYRRKMFQEHLETPHYLEHIRDAFEVLGLKLFEANTCGIITRKRKGA